MISTASQTRDFLFHPRDLPANIPVQMELSNAPFADAMFTDVVKDTHPGNGVITLWLMRAYC